MSSESINNSSKKKTDIEQYPDEFLSFSNPYEEKYEGTKKVETFKESKDPIYFSENSTASTENTRAQVLQKQIKRKKLSLAKKFKSAHVKNQGKYALTMTMKKFISLIEGRKQRQAKVGFYFDYFKNNVKDEKYWPDKKIRAFFSEYKADMVYILQRWLPLADAFKFFLHRLLYSELGKYGVPQNRQYIIENKVRLLKKALGSEAHFDGFNSSDSQEERKEEFSELTRKMMNLTVQKSQSGLNDNQTECSEPFESQFIGNDTEFPVDEDSDKLYLDMGVSNRDRNASTKENDVKIGMLKSDELPITLFEEDGAFLGKKSHEASPGGPDSYLYPEIFNHNSDNWSGNFQDLQFNE